MISRYCDLSCVFLPLYCARTARAIPKDFSLVLSFDNLSTLKNTACRLFSYIMQLIYEKIATYVNVTSREHTNVPIW